jgi:iron-sulfur cluster insertion protein
MTSLSIESPALTAPPPPRSISLSDSAARRINQLNAKDGTTRMFRVTVSGGGCSGFQYGFRLDDQLTDDDLTFEHAGAVLVTDETSLDLIAGAELEFVDDLMGAYFQVRNPNATSSCGCGTSFSIG